MAPFSLYTRLTLDPDGKEIRVLRLKPGTWDSPLVASIHILKLDDTSHVQDSLLCVGESGLTQLYLDRRLAGAHYEESLSRTPPHPFQSRSNYNMG